ncbi:MAG: PPC domain-containing DNA-binding protein [Dehalococcoidales bacterium]
MAEPREKLGKILVRQLPTDTDLIKSIKKLCTDNGIRYGAILSSIGSLRQLEIEGVVVSKKSGSGTDFGPPRIIPGPLQVLNLDGIIFDKGETGEMDAHIHGAFVDMAGKIYGGHIMEGGSIIATRLVVVIGEVADVSLTEKYDEKSGHRLLHVKPL